MKQLLLLFPLLLVRATLPAQGVDFAPVGAKWYYDELDFALKVIPHITESVSKENYQGKWCSKLIHSSTGPLPSPTYVYTQNDTVFFYSTISNQFEMLYDFTAEAGDQWVVGGVFSMDNNGNPLFADTIRVDSTGAIAINGGSLKVWYISHGIFYDWGRRIYEHFGNDMLFAPKFAMWELQIGGLRCFETPDTAFHFVPYPCDTIYSSISKIDNPTGFHEISIAPNPFQETLNISTEPTNSPLTFVVYDQLGNALLQQIFSENAVINTQPLPLGIYYWCVELDGRPVKRGKCVKADY